MHWYTDDHSGRLHEASTSRLSYEFGLSLSLLLSVFATRIVFKKVNIAEFFDDSDDTNDLEASWLHCVLTLQLL